MKMSVDDASSEHGGAQSGDVVCLDIDPQALDDGTEASINTIYMASIFMTYPQGIRIW